MFDLPRPQKYHSTPTCNSENQTLIQPPLWSWYCIMCWRAEGDDLIIVVFMDHWAAGLDFCYWIMGNSFFLLKEWLPNPIRQSAVLGQKAFTSQEQQQCHRHVGRKHSVGFLFKIYFIWGCVSSYFISHVHVERYKHFILKEHYGKIGILHDLAATTVSQCMDPVMFVRTTKLCGMCWN